MQLDSLSQVIRCVRLRVILFYRSKFNYMYYKGGLPSTRVLLADDPVETWNLVLQC